MAAASYLAFGLFLSFASSTQGFLGLLATIPFRGSSSFSPSISLTLRPVKQIATFTEEDFAGSVGDWPYTDADMGRLDNTDDGKVTPRSIANP